MADLKHYVIRGGVEGRERLRLLARVMRPTTTALFERLGVGEGQACLDVGCGGGDVTLELARRVGARGWVVGIDLDGTKVRLARAEAAELGVGNVEFRAADLRDHFGSSEFDVLYARFLLTHLPDPAGALETFYRRVRPGGLVIVEDIDASGCFVYPHSRSVWRFRELYCMAVRRREGDPDIGPRLPLLLRDQGFADVGMAVVQPAGFEGEMKLTYPLTMESIAGAVLEEGLASGEEIESLVDDLYALAADPGTVLGVPRVVQAWGRRPA
jgi:SAM-dependent methyltransferase